MHHLVIHQLSLTLKLSLKVNLVPSQKSLDTEPIDCVGVQIFKHMELKFTNVRMLKFHIRSCSNTYHIVIVVYRFLNLPQKYFKSHANVFAGFRIMACHGLFNFPIHFNK